MKTVIFKKEWRDDDRLIRAGTLMNVPDDEAAALIADGVAEERAQPPGPTEVKADEPEPESGDEAEPPDDGDEGTKP